MIARRLALCALLVVPLAALGETPSPVKKIATPNGLRTITYPVADLVVPLGGLKFPQEKNEEEQSPKTKERWLIGKITTTVAPNTWRVVGGLGTINYQPLDKAMVVTQTSEVHALVLALLATMRRVQTVQVVVEMIGLDAGDALRAKLGLEAVVARGDGQATLSEPQLRKLREAIQSAGSDVLHATKVTLFSGKRCNLQLSEVTDVNLNALVGGNLSHIDIDIKGKVFHAKFNKAIRLVDGETLVLSGRKEKGEPMFLLVTPRVIIDVVGLAANLKPIPRDTAERTRDTGVIQAGATVPNNDANSGEKRHPEKRLEIKIGIYKGDPLGSRETKTIKTLAEPSFEALEGQSFSHQVDGRAEGPTENGKDWVLFDVKIDGTARKVQDGTVEMKLDVTLSESDLDRGQFGVETFAKTKSVKLGEPTKIRLGSATARNQRWVELWVTEAPQVPQPIVADE